MPKHYFLSRFIGSGTKSDPFRPLAAKFGQCNALDLRPDGKRQEGWCLACVEPGGQFTLERETELIHLTKDANVKLKDAVINAIKDSLGVNFKSQTLGEVIAEILLFRLIPGRGLRPNLEGNFEIHLGGLLWKCTEAEAYEFVGKIREEELLGPPSRKTLGMPADLRIALTAGLITIAEIVELGSPTWLEEEMANVRVGRSKHPLAKKYFEVSKLLEESDFTTLKASSDVIWIMMLARDLRATGSKIDIARVASRLRDKNDCEPTKYELFIMASYIDAGIQVEMTDANSTGEFRAFAGEQWVYIECKHKKISDVAPRNVRAVFERGNKLICELMELKGKRSLVQISCRTDPSLEELPELIERISRGLDLDLDEAGLQNKHGKFEVKLLPSTSVIRDSGVWLPAEFDFEFSECTVIEKLADEIKMGLGWGIHWRVLRPGGWIRSVVDSIRQAASQVPANSPNLVYVHIPAGGLGAMVTRIDSVLPEIEDLLSTPKRHGRVNAVILTGEAIISGWSGPEFAEVRYVYRAVENRNARNTLPAAFHVFGRDFTRK